VRCFTCLLMLILSACASSPRYNPQNYSEYSCVDLQNEIDRLSNKIRKKDIGRAAKNIGHVALIGAAIAGAPYLLPAVAVPVSTAAWDTRNGHLYSERELIRSIIGYHCYRGDKD
jgi:hypothetical protein